MMVAAQELLCVGVIASAHGVRGNVKIKPLGGDPAVFAEHTLFHDKTGTRQFRVNQLSSQPDVIIAAIEGVTDRNAAEALRHTKLFLPRSVLPPANEDEFYWEDLIGMAVTTTDGAPFGTVKSVHNFGAGDILEIRLTDGKEKMYSFTEATFPTISLDNNTIVIVEPEVWGEK